MNLKKLISHIRTALSYIPASWENSREAAAETDGKSRLWHFGNILKLFYTEGFDYTNYASFRLWEKTPEERKKFLPKLINNRISLRSCSPATFRLFLDKTEFNKAYRKFIKRAWLDTATASEKELAEFIEAYPSVIAKPINSYGGYGVFLLNREDADFPEKLKELKRLVAKGKHYMVEETISNVDYIKRLAPASLNTIRIVTVLDKRGEVHILAALLRMGNGTSVTDNFTIGGIGVAIDLATGCLAGEGFSKGFERYAEHPYTKIKFEGYKIEDFEACKRFAIDIAKASPESPYVGWDLALIPGKNGETVIDLLEGNIPPGENITQLAARRGIRADLQRWLS